VLLLCGIAVEGLEFESSGDIKWGLTVDLCTLCRYFCFILMIRYGRRNKACRFSGPETLPDHHLVGGLHG
jgi:hypothetical protein